MVARPSTIGRRISIARSIVGNRATSGSDRRPIVCKVGPTINHGVGRLIVRSIVTSDDRSHDQSWQPATDRRMPRLQPGRTSGARTKCENLKKTIVKKVLLL